MSTTTQFADLAEAHAADLHCRQDDDPGAWFAEPGSKRQESAKAKCAGCPILEQCRSYALDTGVPDGVWGGLGERDRRQIWKEQGGKPTQFIDEIDATIGLRLIPTISEEAA